MAYHLAKSICKLLPVVYGKVDGIVLTGAKIPIVLTSRAAPADERLRCIAIAGIVAANAKE